MNLNETVLQKVADWRPTGTGRNNLVVAHEESGWTLNVLADRQDELGCLVWEISMAGSHEGSTGNPSLAERAARIAHKLTCLSEPLKVIEIDAGRDEALIRSERPTQKENSVVYYELFLRGKTETVVRRFKAPRLESKKREQVAFPLTHEGLARIASDLSGIE